MLLSRRSRGLQRNHLGVFTDVTENRTWPRHCGGRFKLRLESVTCAESGMGLRVFSAGNGVTVQRNLEFSCCISDLV